MGAVWTLARVHASAASARPAVIAVTKEAHLSIE